MGSNHEAVKLAFTNGADPNSATEAGVPILTLAVIAAVSISTPDDSEIRIVETVIKAGADLETTCVKGFTALSVAVQARQHHAGYSDAKNLGAILIKAGAKIESVDCDGISVLGHAFELPLTYRHAAVCMLLDAGADTDKFRQSTETSVLEEAIGKTDAELVKQLLARGHDPRQLSPKTGESSVQLAQRLLFLGGILHDQSTWYEPLRQISLEMKIYADCLDAREAIEAVLAKTKSAPSL